MQLNLNFGDIGNFNNVGDLWYIFVAVTVIDLIVLFLTKFFPDGLGLNLNRWYSKFGLDAVLADILIIVVGFLIARYVYTIYFSGQATPNLPSPFKPAVFIAILVGVQAIHDFLFYLGVIKPIPRGHNGMIDLFKDYAEGAGGKIIVGDAAMMVGSAVIAMLLKDAPAHITASLGVLAAYAIPYILYTNNKYTTEMFEDSAPVVEKKGEKN